MKDFSGSGNINYMSSLKPIKFLKILFEVYVSTV